MCMYYHQIFCMMTVTLFKNCIYKTLNNKKITDYCAFTMVRYCNPTIIDAIIDEIEI